MRTRFRKDDPDFYKRSRFAEDEEAAADNAGRIREVRQYEVGVSAPPVPNNHVAPVFTRSHPVALTVIGLAGGRRCLR